MRQITSINLLVLFLTFVPTLVFANSQFSSGEKQVRLLELYSTQSCSSCPPAQAWVNRLSKSKALWSEFIPVVYHINYWDYLGWKDPYSKVAFSNRQRQVHKLGLSQSVYTPMFALDGKEWRRGRGKADLIKKVASQGKLDVKNIGKGKYQVKFSPLNSFKGKALKVVAVLQGNKLKTNVEAGENKGEKLDHDFLVLELKESSMKPHKKEKAYYAEVRFSEKQKSSNIKSPSVVFWVELENKPLRPIQVTGGPISKEELL